MLPPLLQTMRENSMNGWQAQIPDAMASLLLASYSPMAYASSPSMVAPPHLPPPYHNMPMSYAHNMGCAMASQRLSSGPSPLPFSLRPLRSELSFPHGLAGTPSRPMSRPELFTSSPMVFPALPATLPSPPPLSESKRFRAPSSGDTSPSTSLSRSLQCSPQSPSERYDCPICSRSWETKESLFDHLRCHRKYQGSSAFKCPYCPHAVEECDDEMLEHLRAHTANKLYRCSTCMRGFDDLSTLNKHFRIHSGEKPFECPHCKKCFRQSGTMHRHVAIIHDKNRKASRRATKSEQKDFVVHEHTLPLLQ